MMKNNILYTAPAAQDTVAAVMSREPLFLSPRMTAREALAELLQDGCTLLPLLAREEVREGQGLQGEGTAAQSGYALFRGGRLAGMAREKEAHGMDLLLDRGEGRLLALSAPDGRETSLRLAQVRTAVRPVFQEGALTGLSVTCRIQAEVAELRGGGMDEALRSWLEAQAAREAGLAQVRIG